MDTAEGLLPHLEAVFFAIFHPVVGPKVVFQVPEHTFADHRAGGADAETPQPPALLEFSAVSDYVIPKAPLCGRLVTCIARASRRDSGADKRTFKVLGFPVLLQKADKYERNNFVFNLCFVLNSDAEIHAYEPIVRKCARVLRALEEETSFLSQQENLPRLYGIVEQLYEDLNSYYETFIALPEGSEAPLAPRREGQNITLLDAEELDEAIAAASGPAARQREECRGKEASAALVDGAKDTPHLRRPPVQHGGRRHGLGRTVRDALNLKLFPTYPNPPEVHDWDVPVLLLDLDELVKGGWDLTLVKVLPFINGVNHVKRIAQLADADTGLTRQCVQHLLYYSFAILIDIFQFSNMYTVRPQVAFMADDPEIGRECAAYVTLPGRVPPTGPTLLRLYSMLRPGRTLHAWVDELDVEVHNIDVRRFVSFGIIKGFLRRVHRYPVLVPAAMDLTAQAETDWTPRTGAGEMAQSSATVALQQSSRPAARSAASAWLQAAGPQASGLDAGGADEPAPLRRPAMPRKGLHRATSTAMDVGLIARGAGDELASSSYDEPLRPVRPPRPSPGVRVPSELPGMLDGRHCDDELCVRFGMSWPELHRLLQWVGSPFAASDAGQYAEDVERAGTSDTSFRWRMSGFNSGTRSPVGQRGTSGDTHAGPLTGSWEPDAEDPYATREAPSRVKIIAI